MDIKTAQTIDGLLANETFPTFVYPVDYFKTMELKMRELETISWQGNKQAIRKCSFEIAAITINFLESGIVSP